MEAATSGRTLMSTLHSRDTAGLISALRNWDIQDHEIAACLELVVAQRLVRKLCVECRQELVPDSSDKAWLKSLGFRVPKKIFKPKGCKACLNTGYHGRTGVFEVWRRNMVTYNQILSHTDEFKLRQSMLDSGFSTMLDDAMSKVYEGVTSLEETQRLGSHHYYFHMGMVEKEKAKTSLGRKKRAGSIASKQKGTATSKTKTR
jgi:type II secretory ATPase GspE/PulE/Tfp pilus assembly ATPase PilB-like protein